MNTDKNGWPYIIVTFAIFGCFGLMVAVTDDAAVLLFGGAAVIMFWSCVGLFLNLLFSDSLKAIPWYKKLFFSAIPLLCLSLAWRTWFEKELKDDSRPSNP